MKRVVSLFLAVILLLALVPATAVVEAEDTSASALTASPSQLEADIPDQDEGELPPEDETEEPVESGAEDGEEHEEDKTPPVIVAGGDVGTPEGENPAPGAEGGTALTATGRDYVLRVSGALPEDVSLEVREITDEKEYDRYAAQAAARVYAETEAETGPLPYARFFDITLRRADGTAYQPAEPVTVSVDLQDDALNTKGVAFAALHFPQSMPVKTGAPGKKGAPARQSGPELLEVTCGEEISFTAGSFSVYGVAYYYTVDFYYYGQKPEYYAPVAVGTIWSPQNTDGTPEEGAEEETVYEYLPTRPFDHDMTEHHIGGGSSILLSELLAQLDVGVAAQDVKKVEFTDPELISVHARSDDYELTSLAPFTSFEYLYLTLDTGERVEISVADAVGPSGFGTGLEWLIEDDGTLVIRPATPGGAGVLPGAPTTWADVPTNPTIAALANVWPWLGNAHRGQIKKIRIESGVQAPSNGQLRYMFYNCENLTDVDLSGLDMTGATIVNDMFRECTSLVSVSLKPETKSDNLSQINRMFRGCTSLEEVDLSGFVGAAAITHVTEMFLGCTALKRVNLSGINLSPSADDSSNPLANAIFNGATALEEVDLAGATFGIQNMRLLFHGPDGNSNPVLTPALKRINMSGATFANSNVSLFKIFMKLTALEELDFSNVSFPNNVANCGQLFDGCSALTDLNIKGFIPTTATQVANMFRDCSSLTAIDVSDFGMLPNCTNARGMFLGCSALKELNISNLKMTHVGANNRDLGTENLTKLHIIVAENSQVYFIKGSTPTSAVNCILPAGSWVVNLTGLTEDGERLEQTELRRLVAGQSVTSLAGHTVPNLSGAGFLPPGTYVKYEEGQQATATGFETVPETFYLINHLDNAKYTIDIDLDKYDVYVETGVNSGAYVKADASTHIPGNTRVHVYTKRKTETEWKTGLIDGTTHVYDGTPITLVYENAVTDVNGKVHDLRVELNRFEFHKSDQVVYGNGDNDLNRNNRNKPYPNKNGTRKFLFSANLGQLILRNYFTNDPMLPTVNIRPNGDALKGDDTCYTGSRGGTYASFSFTVPDAEPGSTILFFIEDLDVTSSESPVKTWGPGAEGMILGSGCELDTVTLSENSKLRRYMEVPVGSGNWQQVTEGGADWHQGNYIVGSATSAGTDNLDPQCRFYVRADATSSAYTWTSGTGCDTNLLDPNGAAGSFRQFKPLSLTPEVLKQMDGLPIQSRDEWDRKFTFDLVYTAAGSQPLKDQQGGYVIPAGQENVRNDADRVDFATMTFPHPGTDASNQYCIGTYIYEISEDDLNDPMVVCDKNKRYLRIVLYNPDNDAEMIQGFRAVVTAGTLAPGASQIVWDDVSTTVWSESEQRSYSATGSGGTADPNALLEDVYGVLYYKRSGGYEDETGNPLTIDPRRFFPSTSDQVNGGKVAVDPVTGRPTYPVMVDANGTEFYRRDGRYYDPLTHAELQAAEPSMAAKTIRGYTVYKDRYGANYYKVPGVPGVSEDKYYDEAGNELICYSGSLDPAADDEVVSVPRKDSTGVHQLMVDVHGVVYWYSGTSPDVKYFDADGNVK